jgi:glutamyl-Q tRNA(Asp) synthetase
VVRGADLLAVTPRQRYLQACLGYPSPRYAHCPVLLGSDGRKLSKQNHAPPLEDRSAGANLRRALELLAQPPAPAAAATPSALLEHAVRHWAPAALAGTAALPGDRLYPPPGIS